MSEFTPNDLSFLMQYILEFTFFSTELIFSFQFNFSKQQQQQQHLSTYMSDMYNHERRVVWSDVLTKQIKRRSNSD